MNRKKVMFPNLETIAYYDAVGHFINFEQHSTADFSRFQASLKSGKPSRNDFILLSVIHHEMTHWIDHVSTLSGLRFLRTQMKAFEIYQSNDLANYPFIIDFCLYTGNISLSDYFQHIYSSYTWVDKFDRWKSRITVGKGFDSTGRLDQNHPILLINFSDEYDKLVVRVPITTSALYELNATWQEINTIAQYIAIHSDEISWFQKNTLSNLYNPDLALYSSAVHLFANELQISEILEAYKHASTLSTFVLNLPKQYYSLLPSPFESDSSFNDLIPAFIERNDHGFIFFCLTKAFARLGIIPKTRDDYDMILSKFGIPSLNNLEKEILRIFEEPLVPISNKIINDEYNHCLKIGRELFSLYGILGNKIERMSILGDKHLIPPIIFKDYKISDSSHKEWIAMSEYLFNGIDEFDSICGL